MSQSIGRFFRGAGPCCAAAAGVLCLVGHHAAAQPLDYGPMLEVGTLDDGRVTESSGLAASILHPGLLWTHNDSGDSARLYLMQTDGQVLNAFDVGLPDGAKAVDWEDMCSFEIEGRRWLLVGDTGDNQRRRDFVTLWLVHEPALRPDASQEKKIKHQLRVDRRIDVRFADGPRDCESVAFDPATRSVVLISKEWPDSKSGQVDFAGVYTFPLPEHSTTEPLLLERQATLTLKVVTSGDISPDGRHAVLNTYGDAYQYARLGDESWAQAFAREPQVVALGPRGQSEAVCYDRGGRSLFFTAEKRGRPVWRVDVVEDRQ